MWWRGLLSLSLFLSQNKVKTPRPHFWTACFLLLYSAEHDVGAWSKPELHTSQPQLIFCTFDFFLHSHRHLTPLMVSSVQMYKDVCTWAATLQHCDSTAEMVVVCCSSVALYRKTTPNSRQEGNQYCRNQYNTQYLAILSEKSSWAMTSRQVVQSKMSNLPLWLVSVSFVQQPLGGKMIRGLDGAGSEVRAWVRAWVLWVDSIVVERYGNWTFFPKVILSLPWEWHKGDLRPWRRSNPTARLYL